MPRAADHHASSSAPRAIEPRNEVISGHCLSLILAKASCSGQPSSADNQASSSLRINTIRPPSRRKGINRLATMPRVRFSLHPANADTSRTPSTAPLIRRAPSPWPCCFLGGVWVEMRSRADITFPIFPLLDAQASQRTYPGLPPAAPDGHFHSGTHTRV